ncbi:MAG: uracil-DNA glycosylase [Motiliproteus sp.]
MTKVPESLFTALKQPDWKAALADCFASDPIQALQRYLHCQRQQHSVYPTAGDVFTALNLTPPQNVKVVILGQDPYHGAGQAHGLSFSVPPGLKVPPSLVNIYKELRSDLAIEPVAHGCLTHWAEQGVLLLNDVLTVQSATAGSHQGQGWELFSDAVISHLNQNYQGIVFVLWGAHAQKKGAAIDSVRHCVLQAPHPSPLSAYRGFFGCGHFSAANHYLQSQGKTPVDWQLPPLDVLTIDEALRTPTTGQLF